MNHELLHHELRGAARLLAVGALVLVLAGCTAGPATPDGTAAPDASGTPASTASTASTAPDGGQGAEPVVDAPEEPDGSNPSNGVPGGTGSGGSTSTPSATPQAVRTCAPEVLDVVLAGTDSGAGSIDHSIVLTNRGSVACTISGAPTARLLSADENELGAPAAGSGAAGPLVRLDPGATAETVVRIVNVGTDGGPLAGGCTPQPAIALTIDSDVYGRYDRLDGDFRGCAEADVVVMTVLPFRAL